VSNATPIKTLARAHVWKARLLSGDASSIRAFAKNENVNESYVGHHLRLAFLAPDSVEVIFDGRQPVDLDMKRLLTKNIPITWEDQRFALGFN